MTGPRPEPDREMTDQEAWDRLPWLANGALPVDDGFTTLTDDAPEAAPSAEVELRLRLDRGADSEGVSRDVMAEDAVLLA